MSSAVKNVTSKRFVVDEIDFSNEDNHKEIFRSPLFVADFVENPVARYEMQH
jgi:hypothetical protein